MLEKIKAQLNDVIAIADQCPEKYQVKCFEVLLSALLGTQGTATGQVSVKAYPDFFAQQNISEEELQQVFHIEGNQCSIIVGDLKERTRSKKQVKLALLEGVKELLESGEVTVTKENLVEICKKYDAYDSPNFSTNMKKQKSLFLAKGDNWVLTKPGEKRAGEVIKELSQ